MRTEKHIDPKLLRAIEGTPETAIEKLGLVYVYNRDLSIIRKKTKRKFRYLYRGKPLKEKEQLKRIQALVLPPAWENVRIAHLPNGHLQAIGKDAKKRKQYRYHPLWSKIRNQTKFYRMTTFGQELPRLRRKVDKDLEQSGWPKSKAIALVIRLMDETHIRIGSEQYAKRNKTYGLITLRKKHVNVHKDKLLFNFVGKRGKEHRVTVRNKKLIKLVAKCEEIPGWELFKYYGPEGEKYSVDSEMLNEYLHETSGFSFTAKDFRTWAASIVFFDTLLDLGLTLEEKQKNKNLIQAFDVAARALGNTRNVCRKYYVHPLLTETYNDGSIAQAFEVAEITDDQQNFSASENAMLNLIEYYKPKLEPVDG